MYTNWSAVIIHMENTEAGRPAEFLYQLDELLFDDIRCYLISKDIKLRPEITCARDGNFTRSNPRGRLRLHVA